MVLAGGHGQHILAIHHNDKTGLFPCQKLLDHHAAAGIAKGVAREHVGDGGLGLGEGFGNDYAFACRQPISFHHNGRTLAAQVGERGFQFGEVGVGAGGNAVAGEEVLGESLGALKLRCTLARAEAAQAALTEIIDDTGDQWCLGADDRQVNTLGLDELGEPGKVHAVDGHVVQARFGCGAGIAGRHVDTVDSVALCRLPGERVFAPTAAYHQNLHQCSLA